MKEFDLYTIGIIIACIIGIAIFVCWIIPLFIASAKEFWQLALM